MCYALELHFNQRNYYWVRDGGSDFLAYHHGLRILTTAFCCHLRGVRDSGSMVASHGILLGTGSASVRSLSWVSLWGWDENKIGKFLCP